MSAVPDERLAAVPTRHSRARAVVAAWGPLVLWVAVIFSLSSDQFSDVKTAAWLTAWAGALGIPLTAVEALNLMVRKSAHFVEYAILSLLAVRALRLTWTRQGRWELLALAVALSAVCAAFDELRQLVLTSTRTGTPRDVALDTFGAVVGAAAGALYVYRRRPAA